MRRIFTYPIIPLLLLIIALVFGRSPVSTAANVAQRVPAKLQFSPTSNAQGRTLGNDVVVGSFMLHVQLQQRRVTVNNRGGSNAASVPVTQLTASFESWDPNTRLATIRVAIANTGAVNTLCPFESSCYGSLFTKSEFEQC